MSAALICSPCLKSKLCPNLKALFSSLRGVMSCPITLVLLWESVTFFHLTSSVFCNFFSFQPPAGERRRWEVQVTDESWRRCFSAEDPRRQQDSLRRNVHLALVYAGAAVNHQSSAVQNTPPIWPGHMAAWHSYELLWHACSVAFFKIEMLSQRLCLESSENLDPNGEINRRLKLDCN